MTNMISRIWSVLTSFYAKSNSSSIPSDRDFSSRKRGGVEPLEERNLLAVAVATLFPSPENEAAAPALYATETPTGAPTIPFDLNETFSNAELEEDDYTITPVSDASACEGEEDALVPDFVRDGIAYYSATKLIARQVVFDLGDVTPNDDLADGDPIYLGGNSGEFSNFGAGDSPRSGGGDPTTYPLVVQTTCSSSLVNICTDKVNPLQESRCGASSDPLTNSDYVTVTLPTLPFGYRAEVSFSPSAFQYCTAYVPDGADFNSVTSFQYSGGATVYLVPNDNSAPEDDRVVTLTLNTPGPLESGGGTAYDFDEICMTATATIIDDDQWVVTVEATDDKAIERLPGVEPDYGEYTFTRAHNREGIPGDTSYAINLEFKTLQTPDYLFSNYQTQYLIDYTLTTTPLDGEQSSEYLSGFTYVGSVQSYDLDDEVAVTYYQFQGAIPANETSSKLRLAATFDIFDEGDQTLPDDEDPSAQEDEIVLLTLTRAYWSGLDVYANRVGDPSSAEIEIKDGAFFHIGFEGRSGQNENVEGGSGDMEPNVDDENENGIEDRYESGLDEDVRRLVPRAFFEKLDLINGYRYVVSLFVSVTGTAIATWTNPTRTVPYAPMIGGIMTPLATLTPDGSNYFDPLYTEGIDWGTAVTSLTASISVYDEEDELVEEPTVITTISANINSTSLWADIDIDTMNRGQGYNQSLNRPWNNEAQMYQLEYEDALKQANEEERFENDSSSFGKIMLPYDPDLNATFYEIVLQVPDYVDLNSATLSINYSMANRSNFANADLNSSSTGDIIIWYIPGNSTLVPTSIASGGNIVFPSSGGGSYAPSQLGFSNTQRVVRLYVESVYETDHIAPWMAKMIGESIHYIDFSITVGNETKSDSVRYFVASKDDYFFQQMVCPQLRAAYASELVYQVTDTNRLYLKALSEDDLLRLNLPGLVVYESQFYPLASVLSWSTKHPSGFLARIYRDYITGNYFLAYAGTDATSLEDWHNNLWQVVRPFGESAPQYNIAVDIGFALASTEGHINWNDLYITGHSLGGGLASATSIISGVHAYTFNAAGIREETLYLNGDPNSLIAWGVDIHSDFLGANEVIDAYYVDYDVLTYDQQHYWGLYPAVGESYRLISRYNKNQSANTSWWDVLCYGLKCHSISVVIDSLEFSVFHTYLQVIAP